MKDAGKWSYMLHGAVPIGERSTVRGCFCPTAATSPMLWTRSETTRCRALNKRKGICE